MYEYCPPFPLRPLIRKCWKSVLIWLEKNSHCSKSIQAKYMGCWTKICLPQIGLCSHCRDSCCLCCFVISNIYTLVWLKPLQQTDKLTLWFIVQFIPMALSDYFFPCIWRKHLHGSFISVYPMYVRDHVITGLLYDQWEPSRKKTLYWATMPFKSIPVISPFSSHSPPKRLHLRALLRCILGHIFITAASVYFFSPFVFLQNKA